MPTRIFSKTFFTLCLLLSVRALAEVNPTELQPATPQSLVTSGSISKPLKELKKRITSPENREDKSIQITGRLTGLESEMINWGYAVSAFLDRDVLWNYEYSRGTDIGVFGADLKSEVISLKLKYFFKNSWYVTSGLDHRKVWMKTTVYTCNESTFDCHNESGFAGESKSLYADVGVGNQWQWKNFTMGCDWMNLGYRLSKYAESENSRSKGTTASSKGTWDSVNPNVRLQLFRFYLGASF